MGNVLQGRAAIITGAGAGIGAATAMAFAREGADLSLVDIDLDALSNMKEKLTSLYPNCHIILAKTNVTDSGDIQDTVAKTLDTLGRVDILINLAGGYSGDVATESMEEEPWERIMQLNLKSVFLFCKAVIPAMRAQKYGRIVNTASLAARSGRFPANSAYAAAKGGIIAFTRHLAAEVGVDNICVNAIAPGPTLSPRFIRIRSEEVRRKFEEASHLKRMSLPEEQAEAILFLASDMASFVTGITLDANGGIYES